MKTAHHTTNTRERFMPNHHHRVTARELRRAEARKQRKAGMPHREHDPRAVKFHF